jgi:hypothetical protein
MKAVRLTLFVCALGLAAQAQYPGQYPPGQYPPGGQYPGGRNPRYPGGGRDPRQDQQQKAPPSKGGRTASNAASLVTSSGLFRAAAGNQFVVEPDDHRIITFRLSSKTTIQKDGKDVDLSAFAPGDHLTVDATRDDQGYFTATAVKFDKAGTPQERAEASETWNMPKLDGRAVSASSSSPARVEREPGDDRPVLRRKNEDAAPVPSKPVETAKAEAAAPPEEPIDTRPTTTVRPSDPARDADDPGPPSLRRGAPVPRRPVSRASAGGESSGGPVILSRPAEPVAAEAPALAASSGTDDPIIEKAREVAAQFSGTLPNFFCQQVTTRYQSDNPKRGWDPLDVVTAEVAYEDGRESYKNIKVGNKAVNKPMNEIEGTRSTGEFSTILEVLLNPASGAVFRKNGQDTIARRPTYVYKFEISRENSRWRIEAPAQIYYPAVRGTIWIDRETSRVLRLEQQTRNMPLLFPFDTVETATDYDFVRLAAADPYLLPVDAEVLSCVRGANTCSRNRIEFRNYRKFGSESNITFENKVPQ